MRELIVKDITFRSDVQTNLIVHEFTQFTPEIFCFFFFNSEVDKSPSHISKYILFSSGSIVSVDNHVLATMPHLYFLCLLVFTALQILSILLHNF